MKILLISPHLPAPKTHQAGERLVFELIKLLSEKHEIHLVVRVHHDDKNPPNPPLSKGGEGGFSGREGADDDLGPVKAYCREVYPVFYTRPLRRDFLGLLKVVLSYFTLCRKANEVAKRGAFDVIHVEWTETGLFMRKKGVMFIEAHDVLSKPMERRYRNARGLQRQLNRVLFAATKMLERHIYAKFRAVFVLSEYDRKYLLSLSPRLEVAVLNYPFGLPFSGRQFEREEKSLLFLGAMDRGPNVEAVLYFRNDILPLIRKRVPDVKFIIAGSRPLPALRALAEKDRNIVLTGFVDDIEAYYKSSTVFVAPLLTGGGIIVKVLDALASGTPVVTTSIGNEGIGATPGEHLLLGDSPSDFAEQVVRLLQDKALRERVGQAGKEFVAEKYSKDSLRKTLEECYPR